MTILDEYDAAAPLYEAFTNKLHVLIVDLVNANNIKVHNISSRRKTRRSLEEKLANNIERYSSLDHVTDLAGVRIITYFEDEVRKVAQLVEREFYIDSANSLDKRDLLDPDRFGYLSLHYVVKLSASRLQLTEYHLFRPLKAELQIRSVVQHAWAEIEHDLGYKSKGEVPRAIRRRFSRISGLLELVDHEFIGIRNDLVMYSETVNNAITNNPKAVDINNDSLSAYILHSPIVNRIDSKIAKMCGWGGLMDPQQDFTAFTKRLVKHCADLGIETIDALNNELINNEKLIIEFAREHDRVEPVNEYKHILKLVRGIAILYLTYILISRTGHGQKIRDFIERGLTGARHGVERDRLVNSLPRTLSVALAKTASA